MTVPIVQITLLLMMVGLVAYFAANRRKVRAKAGVKPGSVVFVIVCLWVTVRPGDLTVVANWTGVTQGTDLLLYVLVLTFVLTAMSSYIRFREQELRYVRLACAVALKIAVRPEEEITISGSQNNSQKDSSTNVEKNALSD